MEQNFENLNKYKYIFKNKINNNKSYFLGWCYGNIFEQIALYKKDLKKMCLLDVSNDTHELVEVVHLFTNKTIWKA